MSERCKIFRFATEPWRTLWLYRDESLFSPAEWRWVGGDHAGDDAWIFDKEADAKRQIAEEAEILTPAEASHIHVLVHGSDAVQAIKERHDQKENARAAATMRSVREVSPAESFARLEKRGLA